MADAEQARHALLTRLREVLGHEEAATLMENLPPHPWSSLATKDDLDLVKDDLDLVKADLDVVRGDLDVVKGDLSAVKTDVGALRTEMRAGFAHLGEVLDLRFAAQDARFEAFVRERVDSQTKLLMFSILGALLTTAGIALGSAAL